MQIWATIVCVAPSRDRWRHKSMRRRHFPIGSPLDTNP